MIGLVLVTHGRLAEELRLAMEHVVGPQRAVATVCIGPDDNVEDCRQEIRDSIASVEQGDGVVVLTDILGGTPCNLAASLADKERVDVIAGVNLPLLVKLAKIRGSERLADAVEARLDDFAHAEARDGGKPFALARDAEIPRAIANLRFFAHAATQFASECHHGQAGLNYTLRLPLGVVATISPWNLPLYLFTWKIAPALAAGNTVVLKPAEFTSLTALLFAEQEGITSKNVDAIRAKPTSPQVAKFLGVTPGMGKGLGLTDDWAYNVIKNAGNYAEIFDRNLGKDSPYKMERELTSLWNAGGVLYPLVID